MVKLTNILILDECCHRDLIKFLSKRYNVLIPKIGLNDDTILEMAVMLDAYILTYDATFPAYSKLIKAHSYSDAKYKTAQAIR